MSDPTVLNVDDEPQARRALRIALIARGFEVFEARCGEEAIEKLREESPDVILLDVNMPGMNGIETCRALRAFSDVPVIIISVRKMGKERAEAFEAGADQYITKPFDVEELIARIRAVKRRAGSLHSRAIVLEDVEINLESHEVTLKGATLHLTAKEFKLLHYLVEHAGAVVPHRRLLQAVWGPDYGDEVEYLRVFINQVRKKIEPDPRNPEGYVYKKHFKMFPVVLEGSSKLAGCVTTNGVKRVPREEWNRHSVREVLQPCSAENTISPETDAVQALAQISRSGLSRLMVVDKDGLVGVLSLKELVGFLATKLDLEGDYSSGTPHALTR